jgi:hypothetical protein
MEYLAYRHDDVLHAGTAESPRTLCGRPAEGAELQPGVAEELEDDPRWCPLCLEALEAMGGRE